VGIVCFGDQVGGSEEQLARRCEENWEVEDSRFGHPGYRRNDRFLGSPPTSGSKNLRHAKVLNSFPDMPETCGVDPTFLGKGERTASFSLMFVGVRIGAKSWPMFANLELRI
jgi:hypothetical protein